MTRTSTKPFALATLAAAACLTAGAALAAGYPARPVTLVVPYPPGGPTDIAGRLIAEKIPEKVGQPFIVVNKPGASTAIGAEYLAAATPDGYTVGMVSSALPLLPIISKSWHLDIRKDFAPISLIMGGPLVLAVSNPTPGTNIKEFLAYAKANPGKLNFAAGGASDALANTLLKTLTGIDSQNVLYNGGAPVLNAIAANEAQYALVPVSTGKPFVESGRIRFLAVTGPKRFSLAPALPTLAESGFPGFNVLAWYGLAAPAGTPREIVNVLNGAVVPIVRGPAISARLLSVAGMEVVGSSPEELARTIADDNAQWSKAAATAGLKPE